MDEGLAQPDQYRSSLAYSYFRLPAAISLIEMFAQCHKLTTSVPRH